MKYGEFKYKRADITEIKKSFKVWILQFNDAISFKEQCIIIDKINSIRDEFTSMKVLSELRKCLDEDREFYSKENNYYNEADPIMEVLICNYYEVLNNSIFKEALIEKYGLQLFKLAEMKMKCVSDVILEELQNEKKMITEYENLFDSFKSNFDGDELGIWDFWTHINSQNRTLRKKHMKVKQSYIKKTKKKYKAYLIDLLK